MTSLSFFLSLIVITCREIVQVANGRLSPGGNTYLSRRNISCYEGYRFTIPAITQAKCQGSGKWNVEFFSPCTGKCSYLWYDRSKNPIMARNCNSNPYNTCSPSNPNLASNLHSIAPNTFQVWISCPFQFCICKIENFHLTLNLVSKGYYRSVNFKMLSL